MCGKLHTNQVLEFTARGSAVTRDDLCACLSAKVITGPQSLSGTSALIGNRGRDGEHVEEVERMRGEDNV